VIARNSSFTYKGQSVDVKQVERELGVRYVLEGSVRKAGGRVRITGQLIDAQSATHLWADRFDGSLEDVFELQDKIAVSVAGVIEPALQAAEAAHSAHLPYYAPLQLAFVSAVCLGLYIAFLFIQTGWHRAYFLPIDEEGAVEHPRPSVKIALTSLGMLFVALLSVVLLAKSLAPALEAGVQASGAPLAIVGVIIAAIVLLPETAAAIGAAARRQLQASINLALGSAVASIGLSVPVVAIASFWIGQPLELGISAGATVLMALGFVVAIITYGTGRTNLLSGIVHLVLLVTYVFTVFAP
jgi:Ca2+:H+ antiporter